MLYLIIILVLIIGGYLLYKYMFGSNSKESIKIIENRNKPSIKQKSVQNTQKPPKFIPSDKWNGPKSNYIFKKDTLGTGYYIDRKVSFQNVEVQNYDPSAPPNEISK